MADYIICGGELYHYGVPGMKWGKRKAQLRAEYKLARKRGDKNAKDDYKKAKAALKTEKKNFEIDQSNERIELTRKANRQYTDAQNNYAKSQYKDGSLRQKWALKKNKRNFEATEITNKYALARNKAKKDPSYKNTTEYQKAQTAYGKQMSKAALATVGIMTLYTAATAYAQYRMQS